MVKASSIGRLRWGILGTASIADKIVNGIKKAGCGTVTAIASRDAAKARQWASKRNIPLSFGSYEALLKSGEVDVIYNPLPNRMHAEWTINALKAGLAVLCEKPLAMSASEARAVADVAKTTGLLVVEAFMYRYHPLWECVTKAVKNGQIGDPLSIHSVFAFRLDDESSIAASARLGGGSLMDVGCYPVHAARMVFGQEPVRAFAFERRRQVDDSLTGILEFPNGAVATIESSIESYERHQFQVSGTAGTIIVDKPWFPGEESSSFIMKREIEFEDRIVECDGDDAYRAQVLDFAKAVVKSQTPRWDVQDAVANMAVIDALFASAALGRPVDVTIP